MSDLSGLTPIPKRDKLFGGGIETATVYSPSHPFGRVHLAGGGRTISEYGRSYPLPEALTEIRRSKGVRLPTRRIRRLSGNPNGNLKTWLMGHWRLIAVGVGAVVFLGLVSR